MERRFGSWAIPRLGLYVVLVQALGFILLAGGYARAELVLCGNWVLHGEWWRLVSFLMLPSDTGIWILIELYIFYLISSALEREWGTFRFNLFILCGYLLTVAMSFIFQDAILLNTYFLGSIFLAFATLFPNFEFMLFFILPVKVKWLGWLMTVGFAMTLFGGGSQGAKLCVIAAFINYALFFGKDFLRGRAASARRKAFQSENLKVESTARHTCSICGITDQSDSTIHFRYCSTCGQCFCEEHMEQHQHKSEVSE